MLTWSSAVQWPDWPYSRSYDHGSHIYRYFFSSSAVLSSTQSDSNRFLCVFQVRSVYAIVWRSASARSSSGSANVTNLLFDRSAAKPVSMEAVVTSEPPAAETGGGSGRTFLHMGNIDFLFRKKKHTHTLLHTPNLGQALTKALFPLTCRILQRYQGFILDSVAVNQDYVDVVALVWVFSLNEAPQMNNTVFSSID